MQTHHFLSLAWMKEFATWESTSLAIKILDPWRLTSGIKHKCIPWHFSTHP